MAQEVLSPRKQLNTWFEKEENQKYIVDMPLDEMKKAHQKFLTDSGLTAKDLDDGVFRGFWRKKIREKANGSKKSDDFEQTETVIADKPKQKTNQRIPTENNELMKRIEHINKSYSEYANDALKMVLNQDIFTAREICRKKGWTVREVSRDGEAIQLGDDVNEFRFNFIIEKGIVTDVYFG